MKIIEIMVLLASLFAIAGAAFFQLLVLLTDMLCAQHANWKIKLKINIQPKQVGKSVVQPEEAHLQRLNAQQTSPRLPA
jgi:hypothetical protein